jgi:general secretion pathway protein G
MNRHGFSLIELVIVVVIMAILGAIAIPRMSRGAAGAADSSLITNLSVLRNAIDLYATEHGGTFPAAATLEDQLTKYTDASGAAVAAKDATHIFGPYLRQMPVLSVGANKGSKVVVDSTAGAIGTVAGGWYYNATTGEIFANLLDADKDASEKKYNTY